MAIARVITLACLVGFSTTARPADKIDAGTVTSVVARVADWSLDHPALAQPHDWTMAPLYDGLIDATLVTGEPKYLAAVVRAGRLAEWQLGPRTYHADDHAVGHAWLRLYLMDPTRLERLQPSRARFEQILARPVVEKLSFTTAPSTASVARTDRWTWADALYMAPPTLGLLAEATGDDRYLLFADREFEATYEMLFDRNENLFYRDARFIGLRTPNGQPVFWSRGNGWVYAGLARVIASLPNNWPRRDFYIDLFRQMTTAVLAAQQPDGIWYPSLKDARHVAQGETSATALFVIGLASGVHQGILDAETGWPVIARAWSAIERRIDANGRVRSVQPAASSPAEFDPESNECFGTGAVLIAGATILRALRATPPIDPRAILERAEILSDVVPVPFYESSRKAGQN